MTSLDLTRLSNADLRSVERIAMLRLDSMLPAMRRTTWPAMWHVEPVESPTTIDENTPPLVVYHAAANEIDRRLSSGRYTPADAVHIDGWSDRHDDDDD